MEIAGLDNIALPFAFGLRDRLNGPQGKLRGVRTDTCRSLMWMMEDASRGFGGQTVYGV